MKFKQYLTEIKKPKIYFGHPRATYNTADEKKAIKMISKKWPDHFIVNPNQGDRFEGKVKTMGFEIFYKIIDTCDLGVYMTFKDGKWGGGIYKEAVYMEKQKKPIFEVNPWKNIIRSTSTKGVTLLTPKETFNRIPDKDKTKYDPEK